MPELPDPQGSDLEMPEIDLSELDWSEERAGTVGDRPGDFSSVGNGQTAGGPSTVTLVETSFLASAVSLFWLINFYFPPGPILRVLFPIPLALLYLRRGRRAAWMGLLIAALLLMVLMGPTRSLYFIVPDGLLGVLLGWLWRRSAPWSASVGIGTLLCSFGFFFRLWVASLLLGEDLWIYATNLVAGILDWIFVRLGVLAQPDVVLIQILTLGLLVLSNGLYLLVIHVVAWFILERLKTPIPSPPGWIEAIFEDF